MNFHERKRRRTQYYFNFEYKNKLVVCTACSGSGWYDCCDKNGKSIPCGGCNGIGKTRQR